MSAEPVASGVQLALVGEAKAYGAASRPWKERWEETIRVLAEVGQPFTSETIRLIAGEPTDHPNAVGAIFSNLAHQGVIRRVGYVNAQRPSLHNHPIAEWVGA